MPEQPHDDDHEPAAARRRLAHLAEHAHFTDESVASSPTSAPASPDRVEETTDDLLDPSFKRRWWDWPVVIVKFVVKVIVELVGQS